MKAWLKRLVLPVAVVAGAALAAPLSAQAQVYGYYAAPGYYAPPPPPPYAYRPPYGAYYPPAYGGYYPSPTIGLSFGFGGGYRPYYHHYGHYGRRW